MCDLWLQTGCSNSEVNEKHGPRAFCTGTARDNPTTLHVRERGSCELSNDMLYIDLLFAVGLGSWATLTLNCDAILVLEPANDSIPQWSVARGLQRSWPHRPIAATEGHAVACR